MPGQLEIREASRYYIRARGKALFGLRRKRSGSPLWNATVMASSEPRPPSCGMFSRPCHSYDRRYPPLFRCALQTRNPEPGTLLSTPSVPVQPLTTSHQPLPQVYAPFYLALPSWHPRKNFRPLSPNDLQRFPPEYAAPPRTFRCIYIEAIYYRDPIPNRRRAGVIAATPSQTSNPICATTRKLLVFLRSFPLHLLSVPWSFSSDPRPQTLDPLQTLNPEPEDPSPFWLPPCRARPCAPFVAGRSSGGRSGFPSQERG
jgi:hypothetical protein